MRNLFLLVVCLLLAACSQSDMIETDLYFGRSQPNGGMVTDSAWKSFKEKQIDNILKNGSTIEDATGNWRNPKTGKVVTEPTEVVIFLHADSSQISKQIDSLRNLYKTMFRQQSVLRVDKKISAEF